MSANDVWCQPCQRRIRDEGKDFKEEMPRRAVTSIKGIPCCLECSNEIVDTILGAKA